MSFQIYVITWDPLDLEQVVANYDHGLIRPALRRLHHPGRSKSGTYSDRRNMLRLAVVGAGHGATKSLIRLLICCRSLMATIDIPHGCLIRN